MNSVMKRIRFHRTDLETISFSLERYIKFLCEELTRHEDETTRFEQSDKWLQKREKLNLQLTNSKHIQNKIVTNLKGLVGRTPKSVKSLLHFTAEDNTGEYIPFIDTLPFLCSGDFDKAQNILFNAFEQGVIHAFRDNEENGLMKFKKLDVLRLAAYLESHK